MTVRSFSSKKGSFTGVILCAFLSPVALSLITACADDFPQTADGNQDSGKMIRLGARIQQEYTTRVDDDGFVGGDVMGVYIVDYEANNPGKLSDKGNRADNVRHTFDENASSWTPDYDIYWKDAHTRIDVYGYYPVASPESVSAFKFSIKSDQSVPASAGSMSNYEASDFLWGKAEGIEPTSNTIPLPMGHRMASARVTLTRGSGFDESSWASVSKQVLVTNVVRDAEIDLSTGIVTPVGDVSQNAVIPYSRGDEWRAIVVPQTVPGGKALFSISVDGLPYAFTRQDDFTYRAGKMSNFTIRIDRKLNTGDYELTLVAEDITPWENDLMSHDSVGREYVVVRSSAGGLEQAIRDARQNPDELRNLKITGEINAFDFEYMRDCLPILQALNLKDVRIKGVDTPGPDNQIRLDDQIPAYAFMTYGTVIGKATLTRVILPDVLKSIGACAFYDCHNLSGSLDIPEGVIDIQMGAFYGCRSLTGTLTLPSTLRYIGNGNMSADGEVDEDYNEGIDHYNGVFQDCGFTSELRLPENLEFIRGYAFSGCSGLYGGLRLPSKLRHLGIRAFRGCSNITGGLDIPQKIKEIPFECFAGGGFDGPLNLHDGIVSIDADAFAYSAFRGEIKLPKELIVINDNVFLGCDLSGNLVLPKNLITIGDHAFAYNRRLTGVVEFPERIVTIGTGAFAWCTGLEGIILPESLENLKYESSEREDGGAFENCFGIGSIVSRSEVPPYANPGVFNGVPKDNFVLEVPESAVSSYATAVGWSQFKRISAHRNLVCRPAVACSLGGGHNQTLVIDSEGEWEVHSLPSWCSVTPLTGKGKMEVTLTVKPWATTEGMREGDVVFRLKEKDYTHSCHVSQYGYKYREDEFLTLQEATKGSGKINVLIMGDGFNAADIAGGGYLEDMLEGVEHFFGVEPFTSYRDYFNVYTAFPLSVESGVGSLNTINYTRFGTTYTGGVGLKCDYDEVFDYAMGIPGMKWSDLDRTVIIIVPNSTDYGGITYMWESGAAVAFCPKSDYGYPYDFRGVIQHEACGHGFGKLGDEYIYHNAFIDACNCIDCEHDDALLAGKALGWYDNLELTGKMHAVKWSHLIFDPRYSATVDIFEGGFKHSRGVFRSEQNSCMNNNIPYFSAISRESIIRRLKRYAGETFDFEEFAAVDCASVTRSGGFMSFGTSGAGKSFSPVVMKGSPSQSVNHRTQPKLRRK